MSMKAMLLLFLCLIYFPLKSQVLVSTLSGSQKGFNDGLVSEALYFAPSYMCIKEDNLYIADSGNRKIRKIDLVNNIVSTIAGTIDGYEDGDISNAKFGSIRGIVINSKNEIFVCDWTNHCIRKIKDNIVTTFAGSNIMGFINGEGSKARFSYPFGLTIDEFDNLYVVDNNNHAIRKINYNGEVTTIAGGVQGYEDGNLINSRFLHPTGINYSNNELYIADLSNKRVRKISLKNSTVSTVAITPDEPFDLFVSNTGDIYFITLNAIYIINSSGEFLKIAGGNFGDKDGQPLEAAFGYLHGLVPYNNSILFTDSSNNKIKRLGNEVTISEDLLVKNKYSIYPNPAFQNQEITIESDNNISNLKLSNSFGQSINKINRVPNNKFLIQDITSGIYFLTFEINEKSITEKLVVMH